MIDPQVAPKRPIRTAASLFRKQQPNRYRQWMRFGNFIIIWPTTTDAIKENYNF
jgi:hypothetical protein